MPLELGKKLWARITNWAQQNAQHYLYVPIPTGPAAGGDEPLLPYNSYFRLWLSEMFLSNSRNWFKTWYPAVHSSVRLKFGDKEGVTFTYVAQAPQNALNSGVFLNYPLTQLVPYNGGVVELEAALVAMQGTSLIDTGIKVLKDFSDLIAPPLTQALVIAEKVANGIENLLGATNGTVHLGMHQAFASQGGGGNGFRSGYVAIILATATQVTKKDLSVKDGRLHYKGNPLEGYDYLLLRIEGLKERDDWRMKNIEEAINKTAEALIQGEKEKADAYRKIALTAAFTSPDLVVNDRRRVVQAIKEELKVIEEMGLGAVPSESRNLNDIMVARAITIEDAKARGEMSFEDLFKN